MSGRLGGCGSEQRMMGGVSWLSTTHRRHAGSGRRDQRRRRNAECRIRFQRGRAEGRGRRAASRLYGGWAAGRCRTTTEAAREEGARAADGGRGRRVVAPDETAHDGSQPRRQPTQRPQHPSTPAPPPHHHTSSITTSTTTQRTHASRLPPPPLRTTQRRTPPEPPLGAASESE